MDVRRLGKIMVKIIMIRTVAGGSGTDISGTVVMYSMIVQIIYRFHISLFPFMHLIILNTDTHTLL